MATYRAILESITADPRYRRNLDWGRPRKGHPEGSIRAHIEELEQNLKALSPRLSDEEIDKLRILIHVHDTFKPDAVDGVAIVDPRSHASLARAFLAEFCDDAELLDIVQFHDDPYALYQQFKKRGSFDPRRWETLLARIKNWDLFLAFSLIDGSTSGKDRGPLQWLFMQIEGNVETKFSARDIL